MHKEVIQGEVSEKFSAALETLASQAKRDRSVLAAVLYGILSHDTVWEKSDIDLVLVTIDDKKPGRHLTRNAEPLSDPAAPPSWPARCRRKGRCWWRP